ncbi:PDZ domain-containing protein 2 [Toxotes jaculatrix]|uniref:PDZ domain-containing protein 2 n=1 Tax=Toxotes jaculatrix TaxID=941984 RepID=UPI001B3AF43A|nr:PDZ domain-containing protein 2 [Toxotes jaculatrix]XP_040901376.1 PDZ domain-containing protein 2 [Toxotes jaculatrix]
MDLSLHPTTVSECNKQGTGARFTVRSASSPSYSLSRRPGVRKARSLSVEEREDTKEAGKRERYGTNHGTNVTNKEEDGVTSYQARTGCHSRVRGQYGEKEGCEMSPKLNQNGTGDKIITEFGTDRSENPAFESRGRTEWRTHDLPSRSKSLDWRTEVRSPDRFTRASMLSTKRGEDMNKQAGGLDEKRTGAEGVRGRVMSSIHVYDSAGTRDVVLERNPLSHMSQTLDRASRGHSLPSRLRSLSGSRFTETATSFGPKGGQSILERIEKLYGSAGFGKAEDYSKTPITTPDSPISPQQRSYERAAGGTFPRRFSSGEKNSLHPVPSRKSVTWTPQKDTSGSDSSLSPERSRRLSGGQCQEQIQSKYSQEGGVNCEKGLVEISTRSLDRARSRNTAAAQIRSARATGGITAPSESNTFLKEETSVFLKDSFGFRERRANESKDQGRTKHGEEKCGTNGINRAKETDEKEKNEMKNSSPDEVFESRKITMKTTERKKFPEMLPVTSAASVRNKISQFEALSLRAQGLATGQVLVPRRAFSVPTKLSRSHDGVKKSESAKEIGVLRDKWEGLKGVGEVDDKSEEKVTGAGKKLVSERSLSMDEVGLRFGRKEREGNNLVPSERKEMDSGNDCAEDFGKYSRLKSTLEIPLNGEAQRRLRNFYMDETDFSKVSSPEEASEKDMMANNVPSLLLSNSSDASTNVQKVTASGITSPVSDDDKTPTNTPNHSPFLSPTSLRENAPPIADKYDSNSVFTQPAKAPDPESPPLHHPLTTSNLPSPLNTANRKGKKQVLDMDAWVAGLNPEIKVWNDDEDDYEDDDDESTQKDEDSNYDSDSGESSVTITSNMSQSDRKSFCVSLSDLCNFAGVDYESENDSDEWQTTGRRSASLSSDVSALSCVSVMPTEELDRLLEDVRSLGDNTLQDYDDVQVVVLHKEVGVGLGFSVAGGVDQNKPVTVHKVFHSGVAAQEGSIREGNQVLSINGTALCGYAHWEALRVLRRAKTREMGVVVLRRGGASSIPKSRMHTDNQGPTETQLTETDQHVCVRLEKKNRDLGFSLEGGEGSSLGNRPLTVQKIFQGGPVDKVCPGDEVLEIEGVSMVGMRRLEAWTLIKKLPPGPVDVVLRRPLKQVET